MGFVTGFTGGVTVTLSAAYLSVLAHQQIRSTQSQYLRAHTFALQSAIDGTPFPADASLPRAETEAQERAARVERAVARRRASTVESVKDAWNAEVEGAARWAHGLDLAAKREYVEDVAAALWRRAVGGAEGPAPGEVVGAVKDKAAEVGKAVEGKAGEVRDRGGAVVAAAREAVDRKAAAAREVLDQKAGAAKEALDKKVAAAAAESKKLAAEAKSGVAAAVEKGKEAVGLAEKKVSDEAAKLKAGASAVERTLQQRFEKGAANSKPKTVSEALAERYKPIDQRDNTVLRGV